MNKFEQGKPMAELRLMPCLLLIRFFLNMTSF